MLAPCAVCAPGVPAAVATAAAAGGGVADAGHVKRHM
jgi:hypothetical protein